ncbi:MAG TPA: FAD-binding oxidoreductase [Sphingobium sp.]|uniref:FAD-binding oxidoreductase n=1 Tax=Sphingobium sp. TaxID=1912891 RepID=UPI002ED6413D
MSREFDAALADIVGARHFQVGDAIGERYRLDISRKYASNPVGVAKPGSIDEVSAIMRLAHAHGVPVTVVGGQSGTCGAAVPSDGGLALSLERMNEVEEVDLVSMTMTVGAGCILQVAQERAEEQGVFLPLDLGARGSATIGGVIGTNAGGNRVIRWGMMRDMVLGLEAVLADGTVVSSLGKMIKDNAGYAWKHLLIGSEGTLGIVTRAVMRLRPLPTNRQTALVGLSSFADAITVLRRLDVSLSGQLSSFELMWKDFYRLHSEAQLAQRPCPMPHDYPIYALVETMGGEEEGDAERFQRGLIRLIEEGLVADAVIGQSERERDGLWAVREELEPGFAPLRPFAAYDVSVAIADMPAYVDQARAAVLKKFPNAVVLFYGHAGDGNLHALCSVGRMDSGIQFALDDAIYGTLRPYGGSVSAEHGIGTTRAPWLGHSRSETELALMRTIKQALDPKGVLNPGKILGHAASAQKTADDVGGPVGSELPPVIV